MGKQRHQHLHAGATTNTTSLAAADCRSSTSACSNQQAAAAWAWFEHGGSSCVTSHKAEGLIGAKRRAKHSSAQPSRFRLEVLISISRKISQQGSADHAMTEAGNPRRRHSFENNNLTDLTSYMYWRVSSSCRSMQNSPWFNSDNDAIDDQDIEAENEENQNPLCSQNEASSLLDAFELQAVCKQLHDRRSSAGRSPSCSPSPSLSSTRSAKPQESHVPQNVHRDHRQAHLKQRHYLKSNHATFQKRPLADTEHHHNIMNDVAHRLLRLRTKTWSGHSTSAVLGPLCTSISIADSIVDQHGCRSPKQLKAVITPINQMGKRQDIVLHNQGIRPDVGRRVSNYHDENLNFNQISSTANEGSAAADEYKRGDSTWWPHRPQQKVLRRNHELTGDAFSPSCLHQSDSKYSKTVQLRESRLPHMSPLLGDHMHGGRSWRGDGVACTNRHCHFHEHHHIHHHHHYHHQLQKKTLRASEATVGDPLGGQEGVGARVPEALKLYKLHKQEEV